VFTGVNAAPSLPALARVDGNVVLTGYGAATFTANALVSIGGSLAIVSSAANNVSLPNLQTITDAFTINGAAVDTMTFTDLTVIGGEFSVAATGNLSCPEIAAVYCPLDVRDPVPVTVTVQGAANCNTTVNNGC
jgi:hypothetical protein